MAILVISSTVLTLVVLSPYALRSVATLPGMDWMQLSNVGQTYGAASALLSAAALIGVVVSVAMQARGDYVGRKHAARTFHHELLRMAMDDPMYMQCWGTGGANLTYDERRRYFYINLIIAYHEMRWDIGDLRESEVRLAAAHQWFTSEAFRLFWRDWGSGWVAIAGAYPRSRRREFVGLVDEEYRKAVAAGPPTHRVVTVTPARCAVRRIGAVGFLIGVAVGGAAGSRLLGGRRLRSPVRDR